MLNLERNRFTHHATRSPDAHYLEKDNVRYNFYPRSTDRGIPNVKKTHPLLGCSLTG